MDEEEGDETTDYGLVVEGGGARQRTYRCSFMCVLLGRVMFPALYEGPRHGYVSRGGRSH